MKLMNASAAALSCVFAFACGTETGNGLVKVKTGLNGLAAADAQGTALTFDSAHAYVRHIEFHRSADDSLIRIEGPFDVDLMSRTATPSLEGVEVDAGTYKRIDVQFSSKAGPQKDTLVASGHIAYPAGSSTPFDLMLKFEEQAKFEGADGVTVEKDAAATALLDLDVNQWFAAVPVTQCLEDGDLTIENGRILIQDHGQRCSQIEVQLTQTIRASGRLRSQ